MGKTGSEGLISRFCSGCTRMNTPENMELYLIQAFARDRILEELRNQDWRADRLHYEERFIECRRLV